MLKFFKHSVGYSNKIFHAVIRLLRWIKTENKNIIRFISTGR